MLRNNLSAPLSDLFPDLAAFLGCGTPGEWIEKALENSDILLIDHANCEKKAASTALNLMFKYIHHEDLLNKMSRLAREELLHFEQVLALMKKRNVHYRPLSASRYPGLMREQVRPREPGQLVDILVAGAFIEARSCERFHKLAFHVDDELAKFYRSLLLSEGRHFKDYLMLAENIAQTDISDRIAVFAAIDQQAVESDDQQFRFHSGKPALKIC
ncbi:tRNA hydroxylase [Endozoicomonas montiporae]|uniref:tRNA hydroxylase n=2 Tax=Endozoicomonas montiporae TaxID=1027273 RepID=A0A081NBY8_9GAMM|nr:tRNA isopentenyl-2-thiomethyl-A-37 hydroxylase MiaE [Endozoicomonas montiporae]AMO56281.1 tRNA--hydroxylase [Endozoicomonas montiporae CL-33]KEQ15961.1 tRNA hydroxylase [Endozoicomonas montiporae]